MAMNEKIRMACGMKRRFSDIITDEACGVPDMAPRPFKRMSPFHNTPIQKKETKRRILKISLKKMNGISCPETFLRRSVLINNLARSLQDDLKDDKLWDRWGWECDLDTFPCRSPPPHPIPHKPSSYDVTGDTSTTCTLLTNACTSSSAISQWTVSTHANWMNGDDDAHLSPSERERVTRDLSQSHDKLAQTLEQLTSFDLDFPSDHHPQKPRISDCAKASVINVYDSNGHIGCLDVGVNHQSDRTKYLASSSCSRSVSASKALPNSSASAPVSCQFQYTMTSHPQCSVVSTSNTSSSCCYNGSSQNQQQSNTMGHNQCQFQYGSTNVKTTPSSCSKESQKPNGTDQWRTSSDCLQTSCGFSDDISSSYIDISHNVFNSSDSSSSPSVGGGELWDLCTCNGSELHTVPSRNLIHSPDGATAALCNGYHGNRTLKQIPELCGSQNGCHGHHHTEMTLSSDIWDIESNVEPPISGNSSHTLQGPGVSTSPVSCSTEADISERLGSPGFANDQERYLSHGLRDFDVIYNNLVSVLIGGN